MNNTTTSKILNWIDGQDNLDQLFEESLKVYLRNWKASDEEDFLEVFKSLELSALPLRFDSVRYTVYENREDEHGNPLEAFVLSQVLPKCDDSEFNYYLILDIDGEAIDDGIEMIKN